MRFVCGGLDTNEKHCITCVRMGFVDSETTRSLGAGEDIRVKSEPLGKPGLIECGPSYQYTASYHHSNREASI